ncbi:DUF1801 domain-containing protein [Dactylosporangium salmoneum]|uniref:DUF1801 domain-containing protein n=1 Tax=Dactylosporangium salmoneum TaxID=53361 RepID=A0ABN3HHU1_9ACTN
MAKQAFTAEERAAMKERAKEQKAAATKAEDAAAVLEKIAEFDPDDRELATRVHEIVTTAAPQLDPKLWYGQPAYARDGKVVCFFQPAGKFKTRYSTFGFQDPAALDDGGMWPVAFALTDDVSPDDEARLAGLVKRAAG